MVKNMVRLGWTRYSQQASKRWYYLINARCRTSRVVILE
jgi:hypothetical protein